MPVSLTGKKYITLTVTGFTKLNTPFVRWCQIAKRQMDSILRCCFTKNLLKDFSIRLDTIKFTLTSFPTCGIQPSLEDNISSGESTHALWGNASWRDTKEITPYFGQNTSTSHNTCSLWKGVLPAGEKPFNFKFRKVALYFVEWASGV